VLAPLLEQRAEELAAARMRVFFAELRQGLVELTEDLVMSDNFVHAFLATSAAAVRARREEKVRFLAHLLAGATSAMPQYLDDGYEELLDSLQSLSWREIRLLDMLQQGNMAVGTREHAGEFRASFREKVKAQLGIEEAEIIPMVQRLARCGFIQMPSHQADDDAAFGIGGASGMAYGETTPLYSRLTRLVREGAGQRR
jgi:hypothetical protein